MIAVIKRYQNDILPHNRTIEQYYKSCYIVLALYCCSKDYVDLTEWLLYYSDFSAQGVADGGGGGGG